MWRKRGLLVARLAVVLTTLSLVLPGGLGARAADLVTRQPLYLRVGPGLEYDIVTVVPGGMAVSPLGGPVEGWYPVAFDYQLGWVYGGGLAASAGTATVGDEGVNLREGPGLDYAIVAALPAGTTVQLLGGADTGDGYRWVEVAVPGLGAGWVAADYLGGEQ